MIKKKPVFWSVAKKELKKKDKKLGKIIESYPKDFLYSKSDPFLTLARSIVGQQISVKAAQSVWEKLILKIGKVNPTIIKKVHSNTLKSAGLSRQKVLYLKNLAKAFFEHANNIFESGLSTSFLHIKCRATYVLPVPAEPEMINT